MMRRDQLVRCWAMTILSLAWVVPAAAQGVALTDSAPSRWRQHELNRPHAPPVTPASTLGAPPADATVLFDGRDLSAFVAGRPPAPGAAAAAPTPATWKVENGYVEAVPRGGSIRTKESFGDVQLHAEWATPNPPMLTGQDRGNSGIILMGQYEIQVLDSYGRTDTYADGTAGSIYGQYPPLVNASRPPGEWQTYDIYFRRPRFGSDGSLQEPARATVVLNSLLVQNNEIIAGSLFTNLTATPRTPTSCHSRSRITDSRCDSATSGCADSGSDRSRRPATCRTLPRSLQRKCRGWRAVTGGRAPQRERRRPGLHLASPHRRTR